jgi:hypothetical protein
MALLGWHCAGCFYCCGFAASFNGRFQRREPAKRPPANRGSPALFSPASPRSVLIHKPCATTYELLPSNHIDVGEAQRSVAVWVFTITQFFPVLLYGILPLFIKQRPVRYAHRMYRLESFVANRECERDFQRRSYRSTQKEKPSWRTLLRRFQE